MIISRHIFTIKEGKLEEAIEYSKRVNQRFPPPHASRLYLPIEGAPSNVIVLDETFESRSELQSHKDRVRTGPDFQSALARYRELADWEWELWEVVELR